MISAGQLPLQTPTPSVKEKMGYSMLVSFLLRYIGCLVITLMTVIFLHKLAPDLSLRLETTPKKLLSLTEGRWWWLHVWVGACRRGMGASQRRCSLCVCVWGGQVQGRIAMGRVASSFLSYQRWNWNS